MIADQGLHSSTDMHHLPESSVHLMVTSPPYNVGKDYDDDLSEKEYSYLLYSVWKEVYRVLVPGGRACINIANIGRKPYIPLNALVSRLMAEIGFLMRGEIIWNKSASAGTSCAWGSWKSASNPVLRDTHEYILVFSKDQYNRSPKDKESTISKENFFLILKVFGHFLQSLLDGLIIPLHFRLNYPKGLFNCILFPTMLFLTRLLGQAQRL